MIFQPVPDTVPLTLSVAEVAAALGIHRTTVYRLKSLGYAMVAGHRRYLASDIRLLIHCSWVDPNV